MSDIDPIQLIARWLHIVAAVTAAGGAIFMKLALHPASETLPEADRAALREAVRSRWSKVVMAAIGLLLLTGFYNFFRIIKVYKFDGPAYHALFGTKVLLAFGVFALASFLVGRSDLGKKLRAQAGKWLSVLVALVLVVLLISSTLKTIDHKPKSPVSQPAASSADAPTAG
ncbi:MAG: hypothetical protein QM775_26455 [Pirellulales bacterium]